MMLDCDCDEHAVFKVVRETRGKLMSLTDGISIEVHYIPGKWVRARVPGSGLLCFDSREIARMWVGTNNHLQLWAVTARDPVVLPAGTLLSLTREDEVQSLWEGLPPLFDALASETPLWWPAGTIAFAEVRLDRRLFEGCVSRSACLPRCCWGCRR